MVLENKQVFIAGDPAKLVAHSLKNWRKPTQILRSRTFQIMMVPKQRRNW